LIIAPVLKDVLATSVVSTTASQNGALDEDTHLAKCKMFKPYASFWEAVVDTTEVARTSFNTGAIIKAVNFQVLNLG
jgi:hypothetical protein